MQKALCRSFFQIYVFNEALFFNVFSLGFWRTFLDGKSLAAENLERHRFADGTGNSMIPELFGVTGRLMAIPAILC